MPYRVTIADNFHYMDASEYGDGGEFATYAEALARAQAIVEESLRSNWEPGTCADELVARYVLFGDDPFIVPLEAPRFSARDYARARAAAVCEALAGSRP